MRELRRTGRLVEVLVETIGAGRRDGACADMEKVGLLSTGEGLDEAWDEGEICGSL